MSIKPSDMGILAITCYKTVPNFVGKVYLVFNRTIQMRSDGDLKWVSRRDARRCTPEEQTAYALGWRGDNRKCKGLYHS